jgi:hypothetical protein
MFKRRETAEERSYWKLKKSLKGRINRKVKITVY